MKQQLTPKQEAFAIETLKNILHLFHEKRYDEVPGAVDESEIDDLPHYLREYIQGTLDLNDMDTFDEYGAPCSFHPQYEYHQLHFFDHYNDNSQCDGFSLDYEMTSGAELCQLVLQLVFLYQPDGSLRRVFQCVDPQ